MATDDTNRSSVPPSVFPRLELVLVLRHVHALAAELHAFHRQAHALLQTRFALELDLTACPDHALPRQSPTGTLQQLRHVAMVERISSGRRHLSISRHFALRNRANRLVKSFIALSALGRAPQSPLHFVPHHESSTWRKQSTR